jgi:hypothetical protein
MDPVTFYLAIEFFANILESIDKANWMVVLLTTKLEDLYSSMQWYGDATLA